jgi:RNA polymerase sigma-70 factor, ECF subfamily
VLFMRAGTSSFLGQTFPTQPAGAEGLATGGSSVPAGQAGGPMAAQHRGADGEETDTRLMELFCAGDHRAFETLYGRYRGSLRRFVRRLSNNSDEAEEVYQEVWTALIHGGRSYRSEAKFSTYLFSIAHRRLQDRWRRSGRRTAAFDDSVSPPLPDQIVDEAAVPPENWIQNAQLRDALLSAIDGLPPHQREVFLLSLETDLSLEEIAVATGAGFEATKSRLRYAIARLRSQLGEWK